jgi:uncharacterized protein (DUF3820 family)
VATTTAILKLMLEKHSPAELQNISNVRMRIKAMPFGKHKGTDMEKIPLDYFRWLKKQDAIAEREGGKRLDPDVLFTIDSILHG